MRQRRTSFGDTWSVGGAPLSESDSLEVFLGLQEAVAGRYSLEREIARGGMGIVFLARDVSLDRFVAIKLLAPDLSSRPEMRERFLQEARTAARLSHPNIVPLHAVEEVGDFVFFVMAYVEGETLTERVASVGPLKPAVAVPILREIAWALAYAHAQGVVHRDVKPDNILLEKGTGRALMTDFGIALVAGGGPDALTDILGTPDFMSPEQITGEEVGPASDIYSLGALAFYVLEGRVPFPASVPELVLAGHIDAPVPRLGKGIPRPIADVVERCLAKKPARRIASGEELAALLAQTAPVERDLPVPLRLYLDSVRIRGERALAYVFAALWVVPVVVVMLGSMFAGPPWAKLVATGLTGVIVASPLLTQLHQVRRLLKSGQRREDLIGAIAADATRKREELAYVYGEDFPAVAARLRRFSTGGFAVGALMLVASLLAGQGGPLAALFGGTSVITLLGSAIAGSMANRRSDRKWARRIRFWKGRLGKWVFRLAGIGLASPEPQGLPVDRPTEVALGMAVVGMFEALPAETRKALGDLPAVVTDLENDASLMRIRIDRLDELISLGAATRDSPAVDRSIVERRKASVEGFRGLREDARARLSEAMTSLETLRIDLLRMRSGTQSVENLTANLGSARELSERINLLLEAHKELDRELHED